MSDRFHAHDIVERALGFVEGDEADAVFNGSDRNLTRFASSTIHQNLSERGGSLTIRVVAGGRIGVASTSATDDGALRRTAALALDLAKRSEPVEGFRGLHRNMDPSPGIGAFDEAKRKTSRRCSPRARRSRSLTPERTRPAWARSRLATRTVSGTRRA
jgi:predicted Zn-dependent protease